jgi:hypothetical protein
VAAAAMQADAWVESYRKVTKPVSSSSSYGGSTDAGARAAAAAGSKPGGGALQASLPAGSIHPFAAAAAGVGLAAPKELEGGVSGGGGTDQWVCWGSQVAAVAEQVETAVSNRASRDATCHGGSDSSRLGGARMPAASSSSSRADPAAPAAAAVTPSPAPVLRFTPSGQVLHSSQLGGEEPAAGANRGLKAGSNGSGSSSSSRICVVKLSGAAAAAAVKAQKQRQAVASRVAVAGGVEASSGCVSASGAAVLGTAQSVSNVELQAAFVNEVRKRLSGWDVGVEERVCQGGGMQGPVCAGSDSSGGVGGPKSLGGLGVVSGALAPGWGASQVCSKLLSSSGLPWPLGFG